MLTVPTTPRLPRQLPPNRGRQTMVYLGLAIDLRKPTPKGRSALINCIIESTRSQASYLPASKTP